MNFVIVYCRICYVNISMNTSLMVNVLTTQRRRYYANILMNVSATLNILTTQLGTSCVFDSPGLARNEPTLSKHSQGDSTPSVLSFFQESMVSMRGLIGCYTNIPMNTSPMVNVITMQRCKRCTFYSPGLASESEGYPGAFAASGNNAVGVVPFIPQCFIAAFHTEKAQHLRR